LIATHEGKDLRTSRILPFRVTLDRLNGLFREPSALLNRPEILLNGNMSSSTAITEAHSRTTVFVTHAAPEDNEFVLWISFKLAAAGYRVWVDQRRLRAGTTSGMKSTARCATTPSSKWSRSPAMSENPGSRKSSRSAIL
jgi:hypothetical protein